MKKFFDIKFLKFIAVGIANTTLSYIIMFLLYNLFHINYWLSTSIAYVIGSILSFFLNKNFTFKNNQKITTTALKFAAVVGICYAIAYSLAKPLVIVVFTNLGALYVDNIAMLFGMVIFTVLNYVGQRFIAFKN